MKADAYDTSVSLFRRAWVTAASAAVLGVRLPIASLTGREPDAWRRVLGLGLKSDGTKFGLSSFGLDLFSNIPDSERTKPTQQTAQAHFAKRWTEFVREEPEAHWILQHGKHHMERIACDGRLATAQFSDDGLLQRITLASDNSNDAESLEMSEAFCKAHQATKHLLEQERPRELQKLLREEHEPLRVANQVSFEPMPDGNERFFPPDFRERRPAGCGMFNIVARLAPDFRSVDIWLQIHHVATDGAPMQEMLGRLEKSWGIALPAIFPHDDPTREPRVRSVQPVRQERDLHEVVDFIDFAPLLAWRDAMNRRFRERIGGAAPVVCALMWQLARQPEFAGRKFSNAIDAPGDANRARAVAMLGINPSDYPTTDEGFADFSRDYLKSLQQARARTSAGWKLARQIALLPPWLATLALKTDAERGRKIFGTMGLSMLKAARVFSAPMEDAGWYEAFLAIGNVSLPAQGGGTVAAITARGPAEIVRHHPAAIRRAINGCAERSS